MPRIRRGDLLSEGCYAHVISRSIRKLKILKEESDFQIFLQLLKTAKTHFEFKLFHYCLMQTHFHLVVRIENVAEFSKAMAYLKREYCYQFHLKYKLSGPIWRERFRSLLIEDEGYLHACGQYVENNPISAGLVKEAKQWTYSSARHYQTADTDSLIDAYEHSRPHTRIDFENESGTEMFEKGRVIGSDYFKGKIMKTLKT